MIQIGIIGYGRIGNEHAQWINATRNSRVALAFDPTLARRDIAAARGLETTDDLSRLLSDASIDAVLVSTPTSMHSEHVLAALEAGKHVMVEKPMALDHAQSLHMANRARALGQSLSVFHCRRWDIDFLTVRQAVAAGVFGRLINVESRLGQWGSCVGPAAREYRPNWRNEASFGGGGLYDWGSHFVDQLWQLLLPAKPVRVFAQMRGNVWTADCDDFARVVIDFDNGAAAVCEINTTTTRPLPRWHLDGTSGSADSPYSLAFNTHEWAELTFTSPDGATRRLDKAPPGLSESDIWTAFADTCAGKGEAAVSVESALKTMRLLDAARESAAKGIAVDLSL